VQATGKTGALRHGYQTGAALGAWRLGPGPRGLELSAHVTSRSEYWLAQWPVDAVLDVGPSQQWTWRDVRVEPDGADAVRVFLAGDPERSRR